MADVFGFQKPVDPAFPDDAEDGGIIEIDTALLSFQMVPKGGRRRATVAGPPGQACQVVIEEPHVAQFDKRSFRPTNRSGTVNAPPAVDGFHQADVRMDFDIQGSIPGKTSIVLRSALGSPLGTLRVSVKAETVLTVSACRLADIEFINKFDDAAIRAALARAKTTFRNTANLTLLDNAAIFPIECDIGLGNPIVLGRAVTEYDDEPSTVFRHILRKTPPAARTAQIVAVFGWDFEITHRPLVGLNTGRFCFVEFDPKPSERALTLEHEIGHAMGLGHTKTKSIMNGDGISRIERFEADEIETLNTSGNP